MNSTPDMLNPRTLDVAGHRLGETIHELEAQGVLVARMDTVGNAAYRLTLHWPQSADDRTQHVQGVGQGGGGILDNFYFPRKVRGLASKAECARRDPKNQKSHGLNYEN